MGGVDLQEGPRKDVYAYTFKNASGAAGWDRITLKGVFPCIVAGIKIAGISHGACVESDGVLYTFGGLSNLDPVDDVYAIDLETLESRAVEKKGYWPAAMSSHTAVADPETKKVFVYGGFSKFTPTSDVHEYSLVTNEWVKVSVSEPVPPPRSSHASCLAQGSMVVYGGLNKDGDLLNDLWIFNLADHTWKNIEFPSGAITPTVTCNKDH